MIHSTHTNIEKRTRFYILLSCLIALLMARYGLQIGIPRVALTAIIALIALLGEQDEIVAIAMCCIPLHEAVDFFYALVSCAGAYVLKNYKSIRINVAACLVLLLIAWELLHCLHLNFSILTFLVPIVPMVFLIVILSADMSETDYGFIVRVMSLMVATMCIILLTNLIVRADFNVPLALNSLRRLGLVDEGNKIDTLLGTAINPNSLGIICVFATTGLLQLMVAEQGKKTDSVLVIILLIFGTLTSSRTFLVCALLMGTFLVLGNTGNEGRKLRFVFTLALLSGIALVFLNGLFLDLLEYYVMRFRVEDITTGRTSLLVAYHQFIINNIRILMFGVGLHDYSNKLLWVYRVAHNIPHNGLQELIVAWGIPGMLLFTLLLLVLLKQARKYNSKPILLNYIPLLIILVKSLAGQLVLSNYTMLAVSYAYLSLCQNFTLKKE